MSANARVVWGGVGIAVWLLAAAASAGEAPRLVRGRAGGAATPVRSVLIVAQPAGAVQCQVLEDALAAELMGAGLSVVSREKRVGAEIQQLGEAPRAGEKGAEAGKKEEKREKKEIVGPLDIAKATGADAIVTATVLADVVQRNVYDKQTSRVCEVRSEQVVRAVSCTVVRVSDGELLGAGCQDYSGAEKSVAAVAAEWGKALAELLR